MTKEADSSKQSGSLVITEPELGEITENGEKFENGQEAMLIASSKSLEAEPELGEVSDGDEDHAVKEEPQEIDESEHKEPEVIESDSEGSQHDVRGSNESMQFYDDVTKVTESTPALKQSSKQPPPPCFLESDSGVSVDSATNNGTMQSVKTTKTKPPPPPCFLETNEEYLLAEKRVLKRLYDGQPEEETYQQSVRKKAKTSLGAKSSKIVASPLEKYKNPMEYFNHLFGGSLPPISYDAIPNPASNTPTFKAKATVNGRQYEGTGQNKKDAKQAMAADFIGYHQSQELAQKLLYMYHNQNAVGGGQPRQIAVAYKSPVSGPTVNPGAAIQPSTMSHFSLWQNEDQTSYLHRLFGSRLVFSDPQTNRTRHGTIVSINLRITDLPESGSFRGEGSTIEDAQEHASALALRMLKRRPDLIKELEQKASEAAAGYNYASDITSDPTFSDPTMQTSTPSYFTNLTHSPVVNKYPQYKLSQIPTKMPIVEALEARLKEPNSNPVSVLNEIAGPALQYYFVEERGEKQLREFVLKALYNGEEYYATGRSKKDAKFKAAVQILHKHFGISNPANVANTSVAGEEAPTGDPYALTHFEFANQIQKLVKDKFMELTLRRGSYNKYKVIAGIVMTTNEEWDDYRLIAVTTGTKTVKGENLSTSGTSLHDCHAEILSRRCLRKYLFSELSKIARNSSTAGTIYEEVLAEAPGGGGKKAVSGYRVRRGIRFHLYINTTPCGDARIFSPHEVREGNDSHPDRKNRGLIRVKIEAGEGTIPSTNEDLGIQTFDGVIAGQRLLNMSCSDKVLRMNVLGLQGGLLSWFIEPVYLSSMVIGSFYHADHLERAVISRFKDPEGQHAEAESLIQKTPTDTRRSSTQQSRAPNGEAAPPLVPPFVLYRPLLCSVDIPEARQASKSLPYAMNWTCMDEDIEVVDTGNGRVVETGRVSCISKQAMFNYFKELLENDISMRSPALSNEKEPSTYRDCKMHASDYFQSKKAFIRKMQLNDLGKWLSKPQEVDGFS